MDIRDSITIIEYKFSFLVIYIRYGEEWNIPCRAISSRNVAYIDTSIEEKHNYDGQKQRRAYKRKSNKRLEAGYRLSLIKSRGKGRKEIRVAKPRSHEGWTHLGWIPASSSYFPLSSSSSSRSLFS